MRPHVTAYMIDGPFPASEKPWLLSNQRKLGIEIQPTVERVIFGVPVRYFEQGHGFMRGSQAEGIAKQNPISEMNLIGANDVRNSLGNKHGVSL